MDRYSARISLLGATQRERDLNRLKSSLSNKVPNSLSCKDILLNGEPTKLVINTGTQPYYKEFESLPGQTVNPGDYIQYRKSIWIVMNADYDDEVYTDGALYQCNHKIRWQNSSGKVVERWAYMANASKYNVGVVGNKTITTITDSFLLFMQIDEEMADIDRGIKVFIDYNKKKPTVYELTRPEGITYGYEDIETGVICGCTNFIVQEVEYSPTQEEIDHWIVGWKDIDTPTIPDDIDKTTVFSKITYASQPVVKVGGSYKTFKCNFSDTDGNEISDVCTWIIECDFVDKLTVLESENQIKIKISESYPELIGKTFGLIVKNSTGTSSNKLTISIEAYS